MYMGIELSTTFNLTVQQEKLQKLLDHVLTDMTTYTSLFIENISISDHRMISFNWNVTTKPEQKINEMTTKEFKKINYQLYESLVNKYINSSPTVDLKY